MNTRTLGNTDMQVSCIGLGGMPLSISKRPDESQAIAVIHAALDAGITFIDSADVYCYDHRDIGHNERLIAKALGALSDADRITVATKGGLTRPQGRWQSDASPDHLRAACDASLEALNVDCIDLYQLHAPDPDVPYADTLGALAECQQAGKVRHIGLSNVSVAQIIEARKSLNIVSVQNRLNLFDTAPLEDGVLAYCVENNIAFLPYSPVGGHRGHTRTRQNETLATIAARHQATPYQVCLAWLLALADNVIPIPGASRIASATSSAAAAQLVLDDDDMNALRAQFPRATLTPSQ